MNRCLVSPVRRPFPPDMAGLAERDQIRQRVGLAVATNAVALERHDVMDGQCPADLVGRDPAVHAPSIALAGRLLGLAPRPAVVPTREPNPRRVSPRDVRPEVAALRRAELPLTLAGLPVQDDERAAAASACPPMARRPVACRATGVRAERLFAALRLRRLDCERLAAPLADAGHMLAASGVGTVARAKLRSSALDLGWDCDERRAAPKTDTLNGHQEHIPSGVTPRAVAAAPGHFVSEL